jgi:hypothetical protein
MKLREKDRVSVNLVCSFQKADRHYSGRVKNMSRNGLLTVWNSDDSQKADLKKGETWQVEIELPVFHQFAPNAFYCQAVVVRVGAESRLKQEVAFRIDRMTAADLKTKTKQPAATTTTTHVM